MRHLLIQTANVVAYGAVIAATAFGYAMGSRYAGYDDSVLNGLLYAAGAFCAASVASGLWFVLSGIYSELRDLRTELRVRARNRG